MALVPKNLLLRLALGAMMALGLCARAQAQITNPGSYEKLRQDTILQVKGRLGPILVKYCRDACEIISVDVQIDEAVSETEDLGFEGVVGDDLGANLFVSKVTIEIQIDDRVTAVNRARLRDILLNGLKNVGLTSEIVFSAVTVPQIGQSGAMEEQLKRTLRRRVGEAVEKVIDQYCPEQCVLSQVAVDGRLITADEAVEVPAKELVRDRSGQGFLRVEAIDVEVAIDENLSASERQKITNLLKAKTRFVAPVNLDVQVTAFPESYVKRKEREQQSSADPFGLEKLRETLKIFRELAGTKEVITRSSESSSSTNFNKEGAHTESASSSSGEPDLLTWGLLIGALLVLAGIIGFVMVRFASASRDARAMMEAAQGLAARPGAVVPMSSVLAGEPRREGATADDVARKEIALRMKAQELRDEMVRIFLEAPKVAKETFSRLLQEEGVESTAKYVHIFGHLVVFELLNDPNLQRDLYELTEYYHKSDFDFDLEEELKLLQQLKTRVTANEIRVLARKQMDKFDFLSKLDATQIYNLIQDEKPQIQSIVLTQLDHKRRRAVFDMYEGQAKVELMRELCRADAIPKEYLSNVAVVLHKKVTSRPEFDTENLRSSDILLDLLEKASLEEQRALMANLMATNPDAARGIKLKLVTLEMLPYLKDGHLLEIIMGLDRQDLLTFLAGTREHIRGLLLSKAPEELAESWLEDLEHVRGIDEQGYRLTEMKILGRIRALASNGGINLLDINDMIFGAVEEGAASGEENAAGIDPTSGSMVA